jgi:acyl-CoA thioesterase
MLLGHMFLQKSRSKLPRLANSTRPSYRLPCPPEGRKAARPSPEQNPQCSQLQVSYASGPAAIANLTRSAYEKKENYLTQSFPGMITSVLNMDDFHKNQHPLLRRNLYVYSTLDERKSSAVDPNLAACAHMYHSDRESVWGMVRNFDLLDVLDFAASLSHTIIFHAGPDRLAFQGKEGRRWFYLETGADRLADGRGLHQGRIFDASGYHVASTLQDGAIRLSSKSANDMAERQRKLQISVKL